MVHNFQGSFEDDGHVVFVISSDQWLHKTKRSMRLVGFSHGVIKRISIDNLAVDDCCKLPMSHGERLTCGYFCQNELKNFLGNFVMGTNMGTLFIGSLQKPNRNRVDINYCRIDNVGKHNTFESNQINTSNPKGGMNLDILPDD